MMAARTIAWFALWFALMVGALPYVDRAFGAAPSSPRLLFLDPPQLADTCGPSAIACGGPASDGSPVVVVINPCLLQRDPYAALLCKALSQGAKQQPKAKPKPKPPLLHRDKGIA